MASSYASCPTTDGGIKVARAIVRYSATGGNPGDNMRNHFRKSLRASGFVSTKPGTACWELNGDLGAIANALTGIASEIGVSAAGTLDHVWIYIDNPA
jgi:hypothetical protein